MGRRTENKLQLIFVKLFATQNQNMYEYIKHVFRIISYTRIGEI